MCLLGQSVNRSFDPSAIRASNHTTNSFAIFESQNQEIAELYVVVRNCRSTEFKLLKL